MQLPQASAGYRARVRYGRYVLARLQRAKREVPGLKNSIDRVKHAGRTIEDREEDVDATIAVRDAADDALDAEAHGQGRTSVERASDEDQSWWYPEAVSSESGGGARDLA